MKRRGFLSVLGAAIAVAAGGVGLSGCSAEQTVAALVKRKLHYLTLDEESLAQYTRDLKEAPPNFRWRVPLYQHTHLMDGRYIDKYAERLAQRYLLSTDFFYTGSDVTRTPNYLGYYDRVERPCVQPFARFELG